MAGSPQIRKAKAVIAGAELDGAAVVVRFTLARGSPSEVLDRIDLEPTGDMHAVHGVGRLLRILRAGKIRPPKDPYQVGRTPHLAVNLLERCAGAHVQLELKRRFKRTLTVWTEEGVENIPDLLDCAEEADGLWVRRRGGSSMLHFPRKGLVRFEIHSVGELEVVSVEPVR